MERSWARYEKTENFIPALPNYLGDLRGSLITSWDLNFLVLKMGITISVLFLT